MSRLSGFYCTAIILLVYRVRTIFWHNFNCILNNQESKFGDSHLSVFLCLDETSELFYVASHSQMMANFVWKTAKFWVHSKTSCYGINLIFYGIVPRGRFWALIFQAHSFIYVLLLSQNRAVIWLCISKPWFKCHFWLATCSPDCSGCSWNLCQNIVRTLYTVELKMKKKKKNYWEFF